MEHMLSIVIPALNEENGIGPVLEDILKQRPKIENLGVDMEVIMVDDGSTDRTVEIASQYDVRVIEHPQNKGYGAALKTGFANAKGDLVAFLDADGTYPPQCFPNLLDTFIDTDADVVLGSRISNGRGGMPRIRYVGNKMFAMLLSILGNTKVSDTGSGMRILKKDLLDQLYPLPDDLEFTPAMSTKSIHQGLNIVETPIQYDEREGDSKLSATKHGWRFLKVITYNTIIFSPMKLFGSIGVILIFLSILLGNKTVFFYISNSFIPDRYFSTILFAFALFIAGLNLIFFGILSNSIVYTLKKRDLTQKTFYAYLYSRKATSIHISIGISLIFLAIVLNLGEIINLYPRHIVVGSFLFLSGLSIITMSILNRLIQDMKD